MTAHGKRKIVSTSKHEENRDQEIADREAGVVRERRRFDSALVRLELRGVGVLFLKDPRENDRRQRKGRGEQREHQDGEVFRHRPGIVSEGSNESNRGTRMTSPTLSS